MIRVGVNGYGTIGKRVADAVADQPDMRVAGVAKCTPNFEARVARDRGFPLFVSESSSTNGFSGSKIDTAGTTEEMIAKCDVVVDATPAGVGARNRPLYERYDVPVVYQGGEDPSVADVSFTARANYEDASTADSARVVSCNTTGLARLVAPLREAFGVETVRATLVRRGSDPGESDRGPINDILPDPVAVPSHHAPDVRTVIPSLTIDTVSLTVPATLMHLHCVNVTLGTDATAAEVRDRLAGESRIRLIDGSLAIDGCGDLRDLARDLGRPRGDLWENCVWSESVSVRERELYLVQAIHQESNVVPENMDAIRAVLDLADAEESVATTNETLGIGGAEPSNVGRVPPGGFGA